MHKLIFGMSLKSIAIQLNYTAQVIDMRIQIYCIIHIVKTNNNKKCVYKISSMFIIFQLFKLMMLRRTSG